MSSVPEHPLIKKTQGLGGPASAGPESLPAWVYRHPEMTRLELARVLRPSWQIVCHEHSIPKAGDFVTFDLGSDSVIVVRERDGGIRAFHNVCRHRGARLLDGQGHCPGPIVCPYHGWSYGQSGQLIGVPGKDTFVDLDRSRFGLKPAHLEVLMGLVFVCLADEPPPFLERWAPFLDEFAPYRIPEMVPLGPIAHEDWDVDWKLAMDNYLESYHVAVGHPGLNRMFTPDFDDQKGAGGIARGTSWLKPQPSSRWSERLYTRLLTQTPMDLPEDNRRSWRFYSALPNLGIDVYPEQIDFFQVLPLGPGRCRIRYGVFGLPDSRREIKVLRALGMRINKGVNAEDRDLCVRVQRGLGSSSYTPGPLSTIETWMMEFHALLEEKIPELRAAVPPAHFG